MHLEFRIHVRSRTQIIVIGSNRKRSLKWWRENLKRRYTKDIFNFQINRSEVIGERDEEKISSLIRVSRLNNGKGLELKGSKNIVFNKKCI